MMIPTKCASNPISCCIQCYEALVDYEAHVSTCPIRTDYNEIMYSNDLDLLIICMLALLRFAALFFSLAHLFLSLAGFLFGLGLVGILVLMFTVLL